MSFVSGFEKQAKEKKTTDPVESRALAGIVGGAGLAGGSVVSSALHPLIFRGQHSERRNKKLIEYMKKKHHIKVDVKRHPTAHYQDPISRKEAEKTFINIAGTPPAKKAPHGAVATPHRSNIAVTAHEMGHAAHLGKNKLLRAHLVARGLAFPGSIAAAALLGGSENETAKKWAPAASAAAFAPMLYQEAIATHHGLKAIHKLHGGRATLKALGRLGPAFGSYAAMPAGAYLALKHYLRKKEEK